MITFPLFFRLRQRHVLQPHLPLRDGFPILTPRDGDAPELLRAPLDDRLGDDTTASPGPRWRESLR